MGRLLLANIGEKKILFLEIEKNNFFRNRKK